MLPCLKNHREKSLTRRAVCKLQELTKFMEKLLDAEFSEYLLFKLVFFSRYLIVFVIVRTSSTERFPDNESKENGLFRRFSHSFGAKAEDSKRVCKQSSFL